MFPSYIEKYGLIVCRKYQNSLSVKISGGEFIFDQNQFIYWRNSMQKILLGLILIAALSANFNDRKGEEFETTFGTVYRSNTKLIVRELDGPHSSAKCNVC